MVDQTDLGLAKSALDDMTKVAAKLANALQDIYNDLGEMEEVRAVYEAVEDLVSEYSGLEE